MSTIYPIQYSFSGADCRAYGFFEAGNKSQLSNVQIFEETENDNYVEIGAKRSTNVFLDIASRNISGTANNISTILTGKDISDNFKEKIQNVSDYVNPNKFEAIKIDSLATISLSIHESKSPVRRLGHMAPSGYTRAIRTIAGSMVLTIVGSDHPLKKLSEQDPKSVTYFSNDSSNSPNIVTKMSPFNLMLMYKSEIPNTLGSKMIIKGIDFINEGIVTSVNDLVSEVVLQFVALDIQQFESDN